MSWSICCQRALGVDAVSVAIPRLTCCDGQRPGGLKSPLCYGRNPLLRNVFRVELATEKRCVARHSTDQKSMRSRSPTCFGSARSYCKTYGSDFRVAPPSECL